MQSESELMNNKLKQIKEKVMILNEASRAYYQENNEIMPNIEFDKIYDELLALEKETGIVLSNSPTIHVGYELISKLPKERHDRSMLSLDKTKDKNILKDWIGDETGLLSWKLDWLTIVLTYENGKLKKAVTRGNGEIGEVITNNAKVFTNIPINISYLGDLVLRGEAVISYSDFEEINNKIIDELAKYKNPRNLCSGSVRQLNNKVTAERKVKFFAFTLVKADDVFFNNSRAEQLNWLMNEGFEVVEWKKVTSENILECIQWFSEQIVEYDIPSDGLVLTYDDIKYSESLGATSKFPRDAIAFKWRDEIKETRLIEIEWSASRTGLINPIAIFEPVELEGTTVSRAGVHNISVLKKLGLGINDRICVYKANMIIPQISKNLTRSGTVEIPKDCPVCGSKIEISQENGVEFLFCPNEDCLAKHIKTFTHFVSRDAMGIDGLSEATVEKLISKGIIKEYADIFHIAQHQDEISAMEGFGEKSFQNLMNSVNKARKTNTVRLLFSLGIPNIGLSNAKSISKNFNNDWHEIEKADYEQLVQINGVGEVLANAYVKFFGNEKNKVIVGDILKEIEFEQLSSVKSDQIFDGLTFVITGSVNRFKNRNEMNNIIELSGGKATDSVTSKTNFLINNDNLSNSSKNKKAKELGINIINEDQFYDWIYNGVKPEFKI